MEYANGQGIPIAHEGHSFMKTDKTVLESICLPRILDVHMNGYITHVCDKLSITVNDTIM